MFFEALAAVKLANEAIGAIKELSKNVTSVGQLGQHLTKLTDAEDQIKEKAADGDMDAFFALEKINQQKSEIKQLFIYSGRAGLWEDWQRFQATRRQLREQERKRIAAKKARQKRLIKEWSLGIGLAVAILSAIGICIYFFYWVTTAKGG